jgi:hypothetical protein
VKIVDLTANVNVTNTTAIRSVHQFQSKVVSRKLLVFLCATGLMIWSSLDPDTWAMIAAMYIGGQSVIDIAKVWKGV